MTDFNPIRCWQRAWDDAHSKWGKACVVLFYLFIWSQIIWAIVSIIAPNAGWECMYQDVSDYAAELISMFFRAMSVMALGFFIYAHREGIKLWNVSMVFIVKGMLTWLIVSLNYMDMDGLPTCDDGMMEAISTITWVLFWWTVLILLCSAMEEWSKPRSTTAETTPLY